MYRALNLSKPPKDPKPTYPLSVEIRGYAVKVHRCHARYPHKFCNMRQIDVKNFIFRTLNEAHTLAVLQFNRPPSACLTTNSRLHLTSQEIPNPGTFVT